MAAIQKAVASKLPPDQLFTFTVTIHSSAGDSTRGFSIITWLVGLHVAGGQGVLAGPELGLEVGFVFCSVSKCDVAYWSPAVVLSFLLPSTQGVQHQTRRIEWSPEWVGSARSQSGWV